MVEIEINDIRKNEDFKGITFSKYKKSKVKKELLVCISGNKIEASCYWSAELICSGHLTDLWETIIEYTSKHIHLGNPKLPTYLAMRFENFKDIVNNGYGDDELRLRNNSSLRKLFAEIICVLCYSRTKHCFEKIKIKKENEFNMVHMASRLEASSLEYGKKSFRETDPRELYVAVNELAYNISSSIKNTVKACYWIEWIIEYESICKKNKETCIAERREFANVPDKFQKDIIWIAWDTILCESDNRDNQLINKILHALLRLYSIRYSAGAKKRRRHTLYFAVALLTEETNFSIDIINNKSNISEIVKRIDVVYKDVKKNEIAPNTDYLMTGVVTAKSNLDRTVERLEKMDAILGGKKS